MTPLFSLFFLILIILCILFRDTVISGAADGLLIWYRNVVPVLLPFMIISRYFVNNFKLKKNSKLIASAATLIIGIFCGYPMGAKTAASFLEQGKIDKSVCQILLPLCNNLSPMFLAGYIHKQVMGESINIFLLFLVIYLPCVLLTLLLLIYNKIRTYSFTHTSSIRSLSINPGTKNKNLTFPSKNQEQDVLLGCIRQITVIGIYIMIFSIILQFITDFFGSNPYTIILAAQMEVTKGSLLITSLVFSDKIKTALIIFTSSFGGISAIYQTKDAVKNSGLSMSHYTVCKLICALMSGILTYLIL